MRHPYKLRRVTGTWQRELKYAPGHFVPMHTLECGHSKRHEVIDSTSDAIRIAFHAIDGNARYRRQCFQCGEDYPPSMRTADLGLAHSWPETKEEYLAKLDKLTEEKYATHSLPR